tara:strand:- start:150 stop:308 length:159 start_codon:yes stop_codon:yes gene_type:complete
MNKKEAIELIEEYGWNVEEGKYFLYGGGDVLSFRNLKELLDYAKMLKKERVD